MLIKILHDWLASIRPMGGVESDYRAFASGIGESLLTG
jgi:hypothetical protein